MFTEKVVGLLNKLIKNNYEVNVKTVKDYDRTMEIYATSTFNKIYKIVLDENRMNKKGEYDTVIQQIQAITDKENLEKHLKIMNVPTKFFSTIEHRFSDKIYLNYKAFEDKSEDNEIELGELIESGIEELEDSKELLEIIRTFLKIMKCI